MPFMKTTVKTVGAIFKCVGKTAEVVTDCLDPIGNGCVNQAKRFEIYSKDSLEKTEVKYAKRSCMNQHKLRVAQLDAAIAIRKDIKAKQKEAAKLNLTQEDIDAFNTMCETGNFDALFKPTK